MKNSYRPGTRPCSISWGKAVIMAALFTIIVLGTASCSAPMQQVVLNTREPFHAAGFSLKKGDTVALLAATNDDNGHEYRKLLGDFVDDALRHERPDINIVPYWETLSVINREGYTAEYASMLKDYASTGILDRKFLNKLALSLRATYFAQPRILDFTQKQTIRFNPFGLTLFQTYETQIKIYLEIWNAETGAIAWIGVAEANLASDQFMARPVSFEEAAKVTTASLMKKMPPQGE
ncbi:MAG: hypothetical protein HZB85_03925 [Deltaproteobacteria bacterium]|nr:hypothetical protein [Deltaproteobacteria bacterium]